MHIGRHKSFCDGLSRSMASLTAVAEQPPVSRKRRKWTRQSSSVNDLTSTDSLERLFQCFVNCSPITAMNRLELLLRDFGRADFSYILQVPEVLSRLQVDIFWMMHLNGFIQFLEYIAVIEESTVANFIYRTYLAANVVSNGQDDGKRGAVPLSICADIVLHLFNVPISSTLVGSKITCIINSIFLSTFRHGILLPTDICAFADILATISCSVQSDASQEMQIQQISRLLSYKVQHHSHVDSFSIPEIGRAHV